jgi:CubicO group peptidase (beta-lactamase class C family)
MQALLAIIGFLGAGAWAALCPANAWPQDDSSPNDPVDGLAEVLDEVVPSLLADGRIPGAVIGVGVREGDCFRHFVRAWGDLQTEPERLPMTVDAVFDLASLTKPLATGSALALLLDEGRLGLDDPVARYLPEFDADAKRQVTIRMLAGHTSGLPAYLDKSVQTHLQERFGTVCRAETLEEVRGTGLVAAPGAVQCYSCLNAILLAEIVEQVSGQPLDQFTAGRVFQPMGMNDTGFRPPARLLPRLVPTTRNGSGGELLRGAVHDPLAAMQGGVSGNAGLFSTAADLGRFAELMLNEGRCGDSQLITADTVRMMTASQTPGFEDQRGVLWDLFPGEGEQAELDRSFGHTGYTGVALRIYPGRQCYIIALTNRVHPDDTGEISEFRRSVWKTVLEILPK